MSIEEISRLVNDGGIVALLIIVLFGGIRRWWVFGWVFQDLDTRHITLREEKNEWKELALHSTNLAESLNQMRQSGWKGPS